MEATSLVRFSRLLLFAKSHPGLRWHSRYGCRGWSRSTPGVASPVLAPHTRQRVLPFCTSSSAWPCPPAQGVVYTEQGQPDHVLKVEDLPAGELHEQQVCVKMLAAPINPSDINRVEGVYPVRPPVPAVGGNEGVGVITAVGSGVKSLAVGDWVIPFGYTQGTWRTHVVADESSWSKVRNDVPVEYAATVSVNPCTALRMLHDFVSPVAGDVVIQNGATSMVGQCVIQLAPLFNLQTINIVRDRPDLEEVKSHLKAMGATDVFSEGELKDQDMSTTLAGRTARLGLNCVGGTAATAVLKLLGEGGTMVTYGGMSKKPVTVSTSSLIFKDVKVQGFWLSRWATAHSKEDFLEMVNFLLALVKEGKLHYQMEKIPFSDFNIALEKAMGKQGRATKQLLVFD